MKDQQSPSRIVRQLRSGQITIPAEFRRRLGINEDSVLRIVLDEEEGGLWIKPMRVTEAQAGSPWLKELYDLFAPVREEAASMSEEEINETIRQAVDAVRSERD
jgi:AbrB family looped-hinge helix DNA binding protein